MPLGSLIKLSLALWLAAEVLVFVLVAKAIGIPATLLLALLSSILGWVLLKRAGASAMLKLRAALGGRRVVEGNGRDVLDDTLASLGALALLMPGFVSDVAGLVLSIPVARSRLARWVKSSPLGKALRPNRRGSGGPTIIDLNPDDWERTGPPRAPTSKP